MAVQSLFQFAVASFSLYTALLPSTSLYPPSSALILLLSPSLTLRPSQYTLGQVAGFEELLPAFASSPLYVGGDVGRSSIHCVHGCADLQQAGAQPVCSGIYVGGYSDLKRHVEEGRSKPMDYRWFARYSGGWLLLMSLLLMLLLLLMSLLLMLLLLMPLLLLLLLLGMVQRRWWTRHTMDGLWPTCMRCTVLIRLLFYASPFHSSIPSLSLSAYLHLCMRASVRACGLHVPHQRVLLSVLVPVPACLCARAWACLCVYACMRVGACVRVCKHACV